jgi:hypothetical protein
LNPRYTCERRGTLPSFLASCREPAPPAVMDAGRVSPTDASPGDASLGDASVGDASLSDVGSDRSESIPPHIGFVPVVEVTDLLPFGPLPRGVACGQATCKEGEKCCLRTHASSGTDAGATARQPIDAYCARVDAKCSCLPEVDR